MQCSILDWILEHRRTLLDKLGFPMAQKVKNPPANAGYSPWGHKESDMT